MIEGISAVTLGTHEMPRAVRFHRALGFEVLHGGEEPSFTSFRAGASYLNDDAPDRLPVPCALKLLRVHLQGHASCKARSASDLKSSCQR
jgi:hypothetical protein